MKGERLIMFGGRSYAWRRFGGGLCQAYSKQSKAMLADADITQVAIAAALHYQLAKSLAQEHPPRQKYQGFCHNTVC